MVSFTESATLRVVDQSTGSINRINAALKQLKKTTDSLKSKKIDLGLDTGKLTQAQASVRKLASEIARLKSAGGTINLRVNAQGMNNVQQQMRQMRAAARNPITIKTLLGAEMVRSALHHTYQAAKEGVNDADIGKTKLDLKQMGDRFTPGTRRFEAESNISKIIAANAKQPGGGMWNRGQVSSQYAEMLGVVMEGASQALKTQVIDQVKNAKGETVQVPRVGPDNRPVMRATTAEERMDASRRAQDSARVLTENNLNLAQTLVDLGFSVDKANEDAIKFGKGIQVQNKVYDNATGQLDPDKAREQYSMINKLMASIGTEATGSNFLQLQKYLRGARFSLSENATAIVMSMYEEMGTTAAVGINQMIRGFGGHAKKYAAAEQARLGLIETKQEWVPGKGKKGKGKWKTVYGDMPEVMANKLRDDPQAFVSEDLEDAWRRDLKKQNPKITEEGIQEKFNDPKWVQKMVEKLASERTAIDTIASLFNKRQENRQFLADYNSRSGDPAVIRALTGQSIRGAVATMTNQFQGMFGEAALAIAPHVTPMVSQMSNYMGEISENIRKAQGEGPDAAAAKTRLMEQAAGGAMAGGLAALGIRAIASQVAPMMGMAAGIQGSMDANPAVRALSNAGLSLIGAAESLKGVPSIISQALSAVLTGLASMLPESIGAALMAASKGILKAGGALTLAEIIGGPMGSEPPGGFIQDAKTAEARRMRDATRFEAQQARERLRRVQSGEDQYKPPSQRNKGTPAQQAERAARWRDDKEKTLREARDRAEELAAESQRRYDELMGQTEKGEGALQQKAREEQEAKPKVEEPPKDEKQSSAAEATKTAAADIKDSMGLFQQASLTTNDTVGKFTTSTTSLGTTATSLTTSATNLGTSALNLNTSVTSMGTAAQALTPLPASFSTAFDTGASTLSRAGATAVADMQAGAGSVGAAIAAAFVAGASGLQIGVKMPETITASARPDVGASKAT
jgi:hypothetical protein